MSAECHKCGRDMGYGELGVPVCDWCELKAERDRLREALGELARSLAGSDVRLSCRSAEVLLAYLGGDWRAYSADELERARRELKA